MGGDRIHFGVLQQESGPKVLAALTDYALARLYPDPPKGEVPGLDLLDLVSQAQAALVAQWLSLGFVHGVRNTDNMSISGETIDYGPCAYLEGWQPLSDPAVL